MTFTTEYARCLFHYKNGDDVLKMAQFKLNLLCLCVGIGFYSIVECNDTSMQILPEDNPLLKRVDDNLNLTCRVTTQLLHKIDYKPGWKFPSGFTAQSHDRIKLVGNYNEIVLHIEKLQERDSGVYSCETLDGKLALNATVTVMPKKGTCSDSFFRCGEGECIPLRFLCDGASDCRDGSDETEKECGTDACEGKILCDDGRCLSRTACCGTVMDPSCIIGSSPPCCRSLYPDASLEQQRRYDSDMTFLQSTVYTVIGCSLAFIFIVTIMVIAVCRVHMKRAVMTPHPHLQGRHTCPHFRGTGGAGPRFPWHSCMGPDGPDIDYFINHSNRFNAHSLAAPGGGYSVTYNINNGVQFVGQPVEPPPYSEISQEPLPEGPPPPYSSTEQLNGRGGNSSSSNNNSNNFSNSAAEEGVQVPLLRPHIIINRLAEES